MWIRCYSAWKLSLREIFQTDHSKNLLHRNGSWTTVLQQYGRTHRKLHQSQIATSKAPVSLQQAEEVKWQDEESDQSPSETIVALSSGTGRSAVAVIRMSGPHSDGILRSMLVKNASLPPARIAGLRSLHDPNSGQLLDKALILRFPGPASFTGEDVVEIQGHGGPAVVRSLVSAILGSSKARLAEAGEFTCRAFMAGKMDLTEVEGLADLLAAETAAQHRQAVQQTSGKQRQQYESWRKTLITCLAHVEAVLDFGDDNDIESNVADEVAPTVQALRRDLEHHLAEGRRGELLRSGLKVALVGPPNAGKSTILNLLAGREAAIVSSIPGTTRDVLEVALEIAGQKVILNDTAGLRETEDQIEAEGVSRAQQSAAEADILVAIADVSCDTLDPGITALLRNRQNSDGYDSSSANRNGQSLSQGWSHGLEDLDFLPQREDSGTKPAILVLNKLDLVGLDIFHAEENGSTARSPLLAQNRSDDVPDRPSAAACEVILNVLQEGKSADSETKSPEERVFAAMRDESLASIVGMTAHRSEGVSALLLALEKNVLEIAGDPENPEGFMITRLRHRQHVEECVAALLGYEDVRDQLELAAEELRYAAKALGRITGSIGTDDILSTVFAEFCIGK